MRTCYIHIGVHKTGSTSIQHSVARHRGELQKAGVYVPQACMWSGNVAAHHNLAFDINKNPAFDPSKGGLAELLAELRSVDCDKVLISSEDLAFSVRHAALLRRLRDPLVAMGFEIRWIVYFRTFPDWAESAYTELAKSLHVRTSFDAWVRSNPRALAVGLDPCGLLSLLRRTGDKVLLRSYSQALPNLLADFYQQLDVPGTILTSEDHEDRINQRLSVFAMEFLTRVASIPGLDKDPHFRTRIQDLAQRKLAKLPAGPAYRGLSPGIARQLYQSTKPTYLRLLRQFRPDAMIEDMFPMSREYRQTTLDTHEAAPEEILYLYQAVTDLCFAAAEP